MELAVNLLVIQTPGGNSFLACCQDQVDRIHQLVGIPKQFWYFVDSVDSISLKLLMVNQNCFVAANFKLGLIDWIPVLLMVKEILACYEMGNYQLGFGQSL